MRARPLSPAGAYAVAVLATAAAILIRKILDPWVGGLLPLGPMMGAVGLSMWFGGMGPAILSVVLGYVAANLLFIEPHGHFVLDQPKEILRLAMYLFSCGILIGFWEAMRRANQRLEAARAAAERSIERQRLVEESLRHAEERERARSAELEVLMGSVRRSEEQLHIITDSMSAPVSRCTRDLRYAWVSQPYAQWLKMEPEEIVGRPIEDVIGEEAFRRLLPYFMRALDGHEVRYEEQVNFQGIGPRWVHAAYTPTFDADDVPDGWVAVVLDIDDRRRAEEVLRDADRRKDEFLATLAHELRNPLAPIRNANQILRMKGPQDPELVWARDVIDRQMQHMTRLIDDLLDVSRITRNRFELRRERVSLARIVQGAVETSRPLIDGLGHRLTVELPKESLELDADVTRLSQVFSNLLNNAAKFTEGGGTIRLDADRQGSDVVVSVRDTGIGMPEDMLDSVFDLFTQVDRSLERSRSGLGIGLTMVKRLVEMHGGSVTAHSEGPGLGSTFVVRLPLPAPSHRAAVLPLPAGQPPELPACRRILVVDDNQDATASLAVLLDSLGYEVRTACDGLAGLELAEDFLPEVALLDIGMPLMNGYDLARRIREQPWGQGMVLVAVTGWGQSEDRQRTLEAGFDDHLVKPVDPALLLSRLALRLKSASAT